MSKLTKLITGKSDRELLEEEYRPITRSSQISPVLRWRARDIRMAMGRIICRDDPEMVRARRDLTITIELFFKGNELKLFLYRLRNLLCDLSPAMRKAVCNKFSLIIAKFK